MLVLSCSVKPAWHARILLCTSLNYQTVDAEKGFTAVAVEADWPDTYDVRYVRGTGMAARAGASLAGFERFRPGCGATPKFSILSAGYAPLQNPRVRAESRFPWSRSLQPLRLDGRGACLFG
jgi:hypothetical protein